MLFDAVGGASEDIVAGAVSVLSEAGSGFSIGPSCGTVTLPTEATDVSAALHIADTRMYADKNGRRAATIISQTRDVLLRAQMSGRAQRPTTEVRLGDHDHSCEV